MGVTEHDIENWFSYHPPTGPDQVTAYQDLREAGKQFALAILRATPIGPDQTVAIRKVREAVMTANAAIACQPILHSRPAAEPPPQ